VLQQEQDSTVNRLSRLMDDDKFAEAESAERPQAVTATGQENNSEAANKTKKTTSLLFIENNLKCANSSITQEDFEVFLRV
jgi:hypothetical protein